MPPLIPQLWKAHQVQGKTGGRLFIATALCGPLAGLAIITIIAVISWLSNLRNSAAMLPLEVYFSALVFGAVIGWPAMLLFGLPAHAFLYKRRSHKIGGYLLSGALLGIIATVVIALLQIMSVNNAMGVSLLFTGGIFGIILLLASIGAASIFWMIRRPDRDVPSPEKLASTFE